MRHPFWLTHDKFSTFVFSMGNGTGTKGGYRFNVAAAVCAAIVGIALLTWAIDLSRTPPAPTAVSEPINSFWAWWERHRLAMESFRNFGLIAAGLLAIGLAAWRNWVAGAQNMISTRQADTALKQAEIASQQARTAEQGQVTDRFSKAIELLGDDNPNTRIGAVHALKRIAVDSPGRDWEAVIDILCNFVRNPPYQEEQERRFERAIRPGIDDAGRVVNLSPVLIRCPDIHAAISSLQVLRKVDNKGAVIDLGLANLRCLALDKLDMSGFDLSYADLRYTSLRGAVLNRTNLQNAKLNKADLFFAQLSNTKLDFADLSEANLDAATFNGAGLCMTNFNEAYLFEAKFSNTILSSASFVSAIVTRADFGGAFLLTREQLMMACADPRCLRPKLPKKLNDVVFRWPPPGNKDAQDPTPASS